jgi:predicted enzyme related to lactoylglutathione lyase
LFINKEEEKETICFTYEVKMVVQVFAEDLDKASEKLEKEGGYVSSRKVSLLNKNTVYVSDPDTAKK